MSYTLRIKCPHCLTVSAAKLETFAETIRSESGDTFHCADAFLKCGQCKRGIMVDVLRWSPMNDLPREEGPFELPDYSIVDAIHPNRESERDLDDLPADVARVFKEAESLYLVDRDGMRFWDPAMHSYRRALDLATKALGHDKGILYARITSLSDAGDIPPSLADLAHEVRLGGNDALHDAPKTTAEQDASDLRDFTELFLLYTFTMPARVKARQDAAKAHKDQPPKD